jgi:uncharacterized NAD(P)/FAD-binding protein YdhS
VKAARVIDCTGSGTDITRSGDPLIQALLQAGMARPDSLRLGLDVSTSHALLDSRGCPSRTLFAVGPLTKGASWEITSVPDIRTQCRDIALMLGGRIAARAEGGGPLLHRPFRARPARSLELASQGNA